MVCIVVSKNNRWQEIDGTRDWRGNEARGEIGVIIENKGRGNEEKEGVLKKD